MKPPCCLAFLLQPFSETRLISKGFSTTPPGLNDIIRFAIETDPLYLAHGCVLIPKTPVINGGCLIIVGPVQPPVYEVYF